MWRCNSALHCALDRLLRSAPATGGRRKRIAKHPPLRQRPSSSLNHTLDFYVDQQLRVLLAVSPTWGPQLR